VTVQLEGIGLAPMIFVFCRVPIPPLWSRRHTAAHTAPSPML
jgi:hypothetical protein